MSKPSTVLTEKRCGVCGTPFRPTRPPQVYCGPECRRSSKRSYGRSLVLVPPLASDADHGTPVPRPSLLDNWRDFAACRATDPYLWFSTLKADQLKAVAICRECPVRVECLATAIADCEMHGVWGGLTELELRERRGRTRLVQCAECGKRFEVSNTGRNPATCSDPCHDSRTRKLNRARQAQVRL